MRIALASDHAGYPLKEEIKVALGGHDLVDFGTHSTDAADLPATECLADVVKRFLPYYEGSVIPDLQAGKVVCLAAHGNSLRALVKHLDEISDEAIAGLNIPTGIPLRYELDDDFKPITPGGEYLDPEAAKEAAAAVANQGR